MRESILVVLVPLGDDRHNKCLARCEDVLEYRASESSASATEKCDRNYQECIEDGDRKEGVMRV
jgi:hypothetical protein